MKQEFRNWKFIEILGEYGSSVIPASEGNKEHAQRKQIINLAMSLNSMLKNKVKNN